MRHRPFTGRWRCGPHKSVTEHMQEAYEKVWKDVHKGRVLLCSAELEEELAGIAATPQGRVPKQNPDRTLSAEGRFVHDQRLVNALGTKEDHPPAAQPRHRELARLILWWKVRCPGLPILIAKRDVDSAYKLIWICLDDVGLFATELPGSEIGRKGNVVVMYLVLTLGWSGSPGNYMAFGLADFSQRRGAFQSLVIAQHREARLLFARLDGRACSASCSSATAPHLR